MTENKNVQFKSKNENGTFDPIFPYVQASGVKISEGKFLSDLLDWYDEKEIERPGNPIPLLEDDGSLSLKTQGVQDKSVLLLGTVKDLVEDGIIISEREAHDGTPPHMLKNR